MKQALIIAIGLVILSLPENPEEVWLCAAVLFIALALIVNDWTKRHG